MAGRMHDFLKTFYMQWKEQDLEPDLAQDMAHILEQSEFGKGKYSAEKLRSWIKNSYRR